MLSIGWSEMLIIAAVALIVVGPRDLPAMLRNIGRVAGQVRRMGNEFRSEINKLSAADEIRDIKKSISQPLAQSRAEIEKEFNKITPSGVEPSGALKPADPKAESVYNEIKAATAATSPKPEAAGALAPATALATTPEAAAEPVKKPRARKARPKVTGAADEPPAGAA